MPEEWPPTAATPPSSEAALFSFLEDVCDRAEAGSAEIGGESETETYSNENEDETCVSVEGVAVGITERASSLETLHNVGDAESVQNFSSPRNVNRDYNQDFQQHCNLDHLSTSDDRGGSGFTGESVMPWNENESLHKAAKCENED